MPPSSQPILFTDGSVNPLSNIGYGAYLLTSINDFEDPQLATRIRLKRFANTSSSKLELQTLLWALRDIEPKGPTLNIYTDSQGILSLLRRRKRLEENDYRSSKGNPIANRDLYREFYNVIDRIDCVFTKIDGHLKSDRKNEIDRAFSLVDKAARKALRADAKS